MSNRDVHGRIFDIKKLAIHDGPGIRTTVFLKGCPLSCIWCHNPESISPKPELGYIPNKCSGCGACAAVCPTGAHSFSETGEHRIDRALCIHCFKCVDACLWEALTIYGRDVTVDQVMAKLLPDRSFFEESGGGVTLSGGEPLAQPAFAAALLKACREAGFHTCVDTSGCAPWAVFEQVIPYTSMFLYDVKFFDEALHKKYTGVPNSLILDNLRALGERGIPIEIRIPLIPHVNDDMEELAKTARFLSGVPVERVRLLPYNELARSKYTTIGREPTVPNERKQAREIMEAYGRLFRDAGLDVVVAE